VPVSYEVDGVQYVAVQAGWGVDAVGSQRRVDELFGNATIVPQGGVVWVFALSTN
jgi:alcohol dehydrogenase (cytochrome c)